MVLGGAEMAFSAMSAVAIIRVAYRRHQSTMSAPPADPWNEQKAVASLLHRCAKCPVLILHPFGS